MKPRDFVAWTLAVGFALVCAVAGTALTHDVWIGDFPRLRAFLSVDQHLARVAAVIGIAALPATFLAFLLAASRRSIKFSLLGVKVEGAAAPAVLWTLVFLCTAAILALFLPRKVGW
jgi:hypothetical protein